MEFKKIIEQNERTISETYEYIAVDTSTINIPTDCNCDIVIVGGGGGGGMSSDNSLAYGAAGGSGACFKGTIRLAAGTYTVIVGGGGARGYSVGGTGRGATGGNTTLTDSLGNTIINAGGGTGGTGWCYGHTGGTGGTIDTTNAQIISSEINSNGNNGGVAHGSSVFPSVAQGTSLYENYGRGGAGGTSSSAGTAGYFKITINASITVDVLKTHAIQQLVRKYYKHAVNGTLVGSLTNDRCVINNFSISNYLSLPNSTIPDWSNSEIVVKFNLDSFSANLQPLFGATSYVESDIPKLPLLCVTTTYQKKIGLPTGANSMKYGASELQSNTWYWVKLVSNGYSDTSIYLSTDGINYNLEASFSDSLAKTGGDIKVGSGLLATSMPQYLQGYIDLTESYIKINNNIWWSGTLPVESTSSDYDFYIDDANAYTATKIINSIEVPYYIPTLKRNGTMGGTEFACDSANSYRTTWNFVSNGGGTAVRLSDLGDWVSWYYPNPTKITNIMIAFDSVTTGEEVTGKFQASNDNLTWIDLSSYTENDEVSDDVDISPVNPDFYNYYRITLNSTASTESHARCTLLSIEQVYMKQI